MLNWIELCCFDERSTQNLLAAQAYPKGRFATELRRSLAYKAAAKK